jgi:hypothetical protein
MKTLITIIALILMLATVGVAAPTNKLPENPGREYNQQSTKKRIPEMIIKEGTVMFYATTKEDFLQIVFVVRSAREGDDEILRQMVTRCMAKGTARFITEGERITDVAIIESEGGYTLIGFTDKNDRRAFAWLPDVNMR